MPLPTADASSLPAFVSMKTQKLRAYEQRIRDIKHASFTPPSLLRIRGNGKGGHHLYKSLASLLAAKRDQHYSSTNTWLRCIISFSLLRSAIQCIRSARSSKGHPTGPSIPCDIIIQEALLSVSLTYPHHICLSNLNFSSSSPCPFLLCCVLAYHSYMNFVDFEKYFYKIISLDLFCPFIDMYNHVFSTLASI